MVNLSLATLLVGIISYTDARLGKIYNKHLIPFFITGMVLAMVQKQYHLIFSAVVVFAFYYFFYSANGLISYVSVSLGGRAVPTGKSPLAGGDLKLATTLALLLGHFPVLYGTLFGILLLNLVCGLKLWRVTGSVKSVAEVAMGKVHAPAAFGPYLGGCTLAMGLVFY